MEKDMKRAERRHHVGRLKKNRRYYWGRDLAGHPVFLARTVDTPTPCSCYGCGNPRKWFGEETMQERKHKQDC